MRLSRCIALVACCAFFAACTHHPQPVVVTPKSPPPETLALQSAAREFSSGNYANASRDYERYLELAPSGESADQALFQLGIIYTVPEARLVDWSKASGFLNRLVTEFPQSSLKPAAQVILSAREQASALTAEVMRLTDETTQLKAEATQLRTEANQLRNDTAQLRNSSAQLNDQIARLKLEADNLTQQVEQREQRIKQLNTQLERLLRVESERRPRP